jgi:hypothetical protein
MPDEAGDNGSQGAAAIGQAIHQHAASGVKTAPGLCMLSACTAGAQDGRGRVHAAAVQPPQPDQPPQQQPQGAKDAAQAAIVRCTQAHDILTAAFMALRRSNDRQGEGPIVAAFGAVSAAMTLLMRVSGSGALLAEPHAAASLHDVADSLAGLCGTITQVMQEQGPVPVTGAWASVQATALEDKLAAWTACAHHVKRQLISS